MEEMHRVGETALLGVSTSHKEPVRWRCQYRLEKRWGDWTPEQILAGIAPSPYEVRTDAGVALFPERSGGVLMAH